MAPDLSFYVFLLTDAITVPALLIMLQQLGKKWRGSVNQETGKRDPVRLLMFLQILFWFTSIVYPIYLRLSTFTNPKSLFNDLNITSLSLAFMIAAGLTLLGYVYHKESWMYAAWFFYSGVIVYMLLTENYETFFILQFGFILVGQTALDVFYFVTGIKYKDNKILGLAIFFFVPIIAGMVTTSPYYMYIYMTCYLFLAIFGIPYAMGKVRFFKQKPIISVEA